jgi:DNA polymerase III gamma/tau subunit
LSAQVQALSVETLLDYFDFMAAGDEEVARSANPRFALEAVLVRLATLPKTLPVAQLIERLEKLEEKFKGEAKQYRASPKEIPAPMQIAESSARASTPAPQASASPAKIEMGPSVSTEQVWRDFVAFVGKEKKFLASHLESGVALELPPGALKIGVVERHHLNYLQDADNFSALTSLAKRFFSGDVSLNFTLAPAEAVPKQAQVSENPVPESSEMVKEALRIFGGSIRSVRREER